VKLVVKFFLSCFIACAILVISRTDFQQLLTWFAVSYGLVSIVIDVMELTKGE